MGIRDLFYIGLLILAAIIGALLNSVWLFNQLHLPVLVSIVLYLNYRRPEFLALVLALLFITSLIMGTNPGLAILSLGLAALLTTAVSRVLPVAKQQPFIWARNLWLTSALILLEVFLFNFNLGASFQALPIIIVLNLALLNLLTLFIEPVFHTQRSAEIII